MKAILLLASTFLAAQSFAKKPEFPGSNGAEAIRLHGRQLEQIGKKHGLTKKELEKQFLSDQAFYLDPQGNLFVHEEALLPNYLEHSGEVLNPIATQIPESSTFLLHSRPGAAKTILLDFTGEAISGTAWNGSGTINAQPFNFTGRDPNVIDPEEKAVIRDIWLKVAEDYAAFDVNVTTDESVALNGIRVMITPSHEWYCGTYVCAGGVAYVGNFGNNFYGTAWVFSAGLGNSAKNLAEAISHEAGHTLGLRHSTRYNADGTKIITGYTSNGTPYYEEYSPGIGSGDSSWAPIMGVGYYRKNTTWHNGPTSLSFTNLQDDIAIISGKIPLIGDDAPNDISNSSFRKVASIADATLQQFKHSGNIVARGDVDVLRIYAGNGPLNLQISTSNPSTNLDFKVSLVSSSGQILSEQNPAGSVNITINLPSVAEDTYSLVISSSEHATSSIVNQISMSDYGSRGRYYITGSAALFTGSIPDDTYAGGSSSGGGGSSGSGGGGTVYLAPTVSAGADKSITQPASSILLQGSASDSDGTIVSVSWTQISGPSTATLSGQSSLNLSASNLILGNYVFRLTAVDSQGLSKSDDVTVMVKRRKGKR